MNYLNFYMFHFFNTRQKSVIRRNKFSHKKEPGDSYASANPRLFSLTHMAILLFFYFRPQHFQRFLNLVILSQGNYHLFFQSFLQINLHIRLNADLMDVIPLGRVVFGYRQLNCRPVVEGINLLYDSLSVGFGTHKVPMP